MKKLKLNLDSLAVQSFTVEPGSAGAIRHIGTGSCAYNCNHGGVEGFATGSEAHCQQTGRIERCCGRIAAMSGGADYDSACYCALDTGRTAACC